MSRKHAVLHTVAILLGLLAVALIVFGFKVGGRSDTAIQIAARQDAIQAAAIPNSTCTVPTGHGYMGVCAPAQAYAGADFLAQAAGDPDTITTPIGIDVSDNNGSIDWPTELAQHPTLKFVYIKATESTTDTDSQLAHNLAGTRAGDIVYGVYDFLRCGWSTPTAEADHFVQVVEANDANASLPPAADIEVNDDECTPAQMRSYVATWDSTVQKALGRVPIDYTDEGLWDADVGGSNNGAGLWAADWATSLIPASSWTSWVFWQYADGTIGPTPHFGQVDMDTFNGTVSQLDQLAGIKPAPGKTTTVTTPRPAINPRTKPKATVAPGIVVGRSHTKPAARAGYLAARGRGNGWWELDPNRKITVKGATLYGRSSRKPAYRKGDTRRGLGDGWWEYIPVRA